MKRLILPIAVLCCVVAASVFAGPVKRKPVAKKKPKEEWYKASYEGKPVGYGHVSVTYEEFAGRRIRLEVDDVRVFFLGVECVARQESRCERDGRLISRSEVIEYVGAPRLTKKLTATIANGVLTVTATGPDVGKGAKKEIRLQKGQKVYGEITDWVLKRHGIGPGDVAEFHVFSSETRKPEKRTVTKVERVKHVHEGKKIDAFRVTIKRAERPAEDKVMIMTTDYELLETTFGDLVIVRCNKKDALANIPPEPLPELRLPNKIGDDIPIENKIDDKVPNGGVKMEVAPE